MGRVPALRAESIFYWIRQEKRKRRDAIAKLEYKTMYFYTEAQKRMHNESNSHIVYQEDGVLPPLPIRDIKCDEVLKEFHSEPQVGTETIHVMNERKENNEDENNFNSQVKGLDVSRVTEQQTMEVNHEQVGNRAARHAHGIALVSMVQRVAEADGQKLTDSIDQVAAHVNERSTLTKPANEYIEKFLALLMAKIASVANKSRVSFSDSFQRIAGHASDFARRALQFCEEKKEGLMFSTATVTVLAQGRAHNDVRGGETVFYAAMAEYMCREIFTLANSTSKTKGELTRGDIKRAFRTWQLWDLCRKLGFGIEGEY